MLALHMLFLCGILHTMWSCKNNSVLYTMVISDEDIYYNIMFNTLFIVSMFSVI